MAKKYVKLGDPTASWQLFDQRDQNGLVVSISGSKIWEVEDTELVRQGIFYKALTEATEKEFEAQEKANQKEVKVAEVKVTTKEEVKTDVKAK